MSAPGQLPLPLAWAPDFSRANFLVGQANAAALAQIELWPAWPAAAMVLTGPEGSGKSHLAAIFAQNSGARTLRADALGAQNLPELARGQALVLEDCDRFAFGEAALFHLFNLARETGLSLLLTARLAPDSWGLTLPDLRSRLRAQPLLTLAEPEEALLLALYAKLFADRHLAVSEAALAYAMARGPRGYAGIGALVQAIDQRALALQKPVTRRLIAACLGQDVDEGEEAEFSEDEAD